ncbi:MAG: hypothetical protein U0670_23580 [Anaerolineae bacterium]
MLPKLSKALLLGLLLMAGVAVSACSQIGTGSIAVPTTGDSINDAASAARYIPNLPGYIQTDVSNISDAITAAGGSASLFTGNPATAALLAQIDGMITCYRNVGAAAAKVYVQADVGQVVQGNVPRIGAMAVINSNRIASNFIPCALGADVRSRSLASQVEPCSNSGSFVVDNETLYYLYAASNPDLCDLFHAAIPAS